MIIFTTIDNINLEARIHFEHGFKIEKYEETPLATNLKEELKQGLGGYYMLELAKKPNRVIIYKEYDVHPTEEQIVNDITYIGYLFSIAWFVKFNLFQIGTTWYFDTKKRQLRRLAVGYDMVAALPNGRSLNTLFTPTDFIKCEALLSVFLSFNFPTKFDKTHGTTNYSGLSVLQRTVELVELSKFAHNIYHKIGLLCSSLECLFTTDANEVTHKVCERVALFLSDNAKEREDVYQKVKIAYGHRSKFFHGDKLKNITDNIYFDIDEIVRRVVVKAITEEAEIFNGSKEQIEKYFLKLLFEDKQEKINISEG